MLIFIVLPCTLSPFLYAMFMPHGSIKLLRFLHKSTPLLLLLLLLLLRPTCY